MYSCDKCQIFNILILSETNMTDDKVSKTDKGTKDHAGFATSVKASLSAAKIKTASIRKTDSQLFVANIVSPAAATLLATIAAAIGGNSMFSQAAVQSEDGGWRLACILVAIFSFIATVSGMFKKQFEDRLTQGNQCVGRLLSLDLAITTGSSNWEDAAKEYGEIVKTFPEFVS
jgi:hypothetical protein